jgi:hypothetical protein
MNYPLTIKKVVMKKNILCLLAIAFVIISCSKKVAVPDVVKTKFASLYPDTKNVKWEKEDGKYEAGFKNNGHEMSALFDASGVMTESEEEIKLSDLPVVAVEYVKANYAGSAIKAAAKITKAGGEVNYEAELKGKDVIFDSAGTFIKEVKE